jgi:Flp pilus assembly protein TadD
MKTRKLQQSLAAIAGTALICLASTILKSHPVHADSAPAKITIDYPLEASIFPPEITPPTFLWHDPTPSTTKWIVEITFAGQTKPLHIETPGPLLQMGTLDPQAGPGIQLTPQQATTHTWRPDASTWKLIKQHSIKSAATITISDNADPNSAATVHITTSADPVGAPVFYRDVPLLLPSPSEHGPIAPLAPSAIPLIQWRIRNLAEPESHTVMGNLPTCANCHSFSRDGKTFGLDLDGPKNDKGLYALVPVEKNMTIAAKNVIRWSAFQVNAGAGNSSPAVKRFGFMSQVSPDGRYVVTSIGPPDNTNTNQDKEPGFASGILDRLYSTNYPDIQFSQVFFPTRGVLAFYDSQAQKMRPLPGADDPQYVQTSAFWSPDGKYLIFSRALARDPYPPGVPKPLHANDPNETQIQYDLYKIPFNEGRGGKAVPVDGASSNGMSNDFPKVSPDGRWIVWVQNKNGLLMRPDSRLFIVPFAGGKPRLMTCNTSLMNSWHTFSPNGRWLAFSSKARGPYTQLMLTHIDENGNDSPAIIVDNTTAANRAVNIPEFVNVAQDGLKNIDPQATEFYRLFDVAFKLLQNNQIPEAIAAFRKAIERDPQDPLAHYVLATALSGNDQESEALEEYRKAAALDPKNATYLDHLAVSLDLNGHADESVNAMQQAIALIPTSAEFRFNLGVVLESRGDFAAAIDPLQKAVELSHGRQWQALAELAKAFQKTGRNGEAIQALRQALQAAVAQHDDESADHLRDQLNTYESQRDQPSSPQ